MGQAQELLAAPVAGLGRATLAFVRELGGVLLFFLSACRHIFSLPMQWAKTVQQIYFIGVKSVAVIALIGLFTGMVDGYGQKAQQVKEQPSSLRFRKRQDNPGEWYANGTHN